VATAVSVRNRRDIDGDPVELQHSRVGLPFDEALDLGRLEAELFPVLVPAAEWLGAPFQPTVLTEQAESRHIRDRRQGGHQRSPGWRITPTYSVSAVSDVEPCAQSATGHMSA